MSKSELKASWAISIRHLAAARFYLAVHLSSSEAEADWAELQHFLHVNELGLALDAAIGLGDTCDAPREYWEELLLASDNMNNAVQSGSIRARL